MPVEIERKFLVTSDEWRKQAVPHRIVQGFLSRDPDRIVRVRLIDDRACMTIKGRPTGITRSEIEFPIEVSQAQELLPMCIPAVIDKTRHEVAWGGFTWEVDEFHGANAGLIVAELELPSEDTAYERPPWIGVEVSNDYRYTNSYLSEHPFRSWAVLLETADPHSGDATRLLHEMTTELLLRYSDVLDASGPPPVNDPLVPRSTFLIARCDGHPVGCAALRPMDDEAAEVRRMFVLSSMRRLGIARRLLRGLERAAAEFGYDMLRLETGNRQPEAIALYESHGFHRIPPYGRHVGDPISICFEKSVTGEGPANR